MSAKVVTPPDSASSSPRPKTGPAGGDDDGRRIAVASQLFDWNNGLAGAREGEGAGGTEGDERAGGRPENAAASPSPGGVVGRAETAPVRRAVSSLRKESPGGAGGGGGDELSQFCWSAPPLSLHGSLRASILERTVSRSGRQRQRWASDPSVPGRLLRIVAGTVPILRGGRVLVCGSRRRQDEWIFPKGGAESDETMEESALRETWEEAGVVGALGPKLTEVEYERRRGKRRRLELEREKQEGPSPSSPATTAMATTAHFQPSDGSGNGGGDSASTASSSAASSEAASDASATTCSHVRMTLYPLYVTEVHNQWPESDRARRVLGIDAAVEAMEGRPEFRAALLEVKRRGLHLAVAGANNGAGQGATVENYKKHE